MTATSDNEEHAAAHNKLRQLKWDRIENFTVFATKFLELANIAGVTESQKINMFLQSLPPAFTDNIKSTMRYQQTFNSEVQPTLKQIIDLAEQRSDVFRDRYGLWYIYASQKFWVLFDYGMRNPQRFMAFSTLVLALLYWQFLMSPTKPNSPIANFAALTNGIFVQINSVDIPASDDITKHALEFKKVANMIDGSPAFASNNKKIAYGLRQFEKKVTRAGTDLKKMYRKGDNVFVTFHTEIEALFDIVDTGKASGLRERTDRMLRVVREFRTHVEKAKNSMLEAENQRDDVEKNIFVGLREAEKYVNEDHWYKSQTDVAIAKRELDVVVDVLKCLQSTGKNLEIILKVLDEYESSLLDVQTELSGMVIYTKADFNYLIRSLKDLHKSHKRFMLKDSKPTIFGWLW